ncbi:MAG: thiamine pyrophosphate-dependent enzyme [Aestuariivita sp.]|nr:thiamine pyrophosphate-dependent enzyme [Aestuariivita sp.]
MRADLVYSFPTEDDWGPVAVISEAREILPIIKLATVDSVTHRILLSQVWCCHELRGLVQSTALSAMVYTVPQVIGLKLAMPERPVVAFYGDAGFLMVVGKLSTFSNLGLSIIFITFVDSSLDIEVRVWVINRSELRYALRIALRVDTFSVIAADIGVGGYDGRI